MLTGDLVRVRRRAGRITPAFLGADARARLAPVAEAFLEVLRGSVGAPREAALEELDAIPTGARDQIAARGLRKLALDACEFTAGDAEAAEGVRRAVFHAGSRAWRALAPGDALDRAAVLAEAAAELGRPPETLEAALFADLKENDVLARAPALDAGALLDEYDLALAQGVLVRAAEVRVRVGPEPAGVLRAFFRRLRFLGLLHVVRRVRDGDVHRYEVTIDGPFSLFESVQRYGLRLAQLLPNLASLSRWDLEARVLWGRERTEGVLHLDQATGLAPRRGELSPGVGPDLEAFVEGFERLGSRWAVEACDEVFALPGEVVCIPDLRFTNRETGEVVHLEAFGFWSRAAVWGRVELLQRLARGEVCRADDGSPLPFPSRLLLAVSTKLRVSEEVLEAPGGEVYVYAERPSPRALLERLEKRQPGGSNSQR